MQITHLAENLRLLSGYGKSVSEICRRGGFNRTQFNRYLGGKSQPSLQSLRRICDFFGVDEYEILLPPETFRAIIRLNPPTLSPSRDLAEKFVHRMFFQKRESVTRMGYYHCYYKPVPDIPEIYVSLVKLARSGRGIAVKEIARYPSDQINLPRRLKFEGIATEQAGKLICITQESRRRKATACVVLSVGDFEDATILDGVLTGAEPEGGNEITTFQTIWRFLGDKPDLRAALKQCGVHDQADADLPAPVSGLFLSPRG